MNVLSKVTLVIVLFVLTKLVNAQKNELPLCRKPEENMSVHLCNFTTDTLTYDQFSKCKNLTFQDNSETIITSYKFTFIYPGQSSIFMANCMGDSISKYIIEEVLKGRPEKILFEEINGTSQAQNIVIGHKSFYFKK